MKPTNVLLVFALIAAVASPSTAEAAKRKRGGGGGKSVESPTPPQCGAMPEGPTIKMKQFTAYAPSKGGINGNCNGGASKHLGFKACTNTLHNMVSGQAKFTMAAAQREKGSAELFGCWAETNGFQIRGISNGPRGCGTLAIVDRYAKSQDKFDTKLDIEVSKTDGLYQKVLPKVDTNVTCVARVPGMQNKSKPGGGRKLSSKYKPPKKKYAKSSKSKRRRG